jgi:hypothetical protein
MNAELAARELELAAYEMSEAEAHDRAAMALRTKAAQRISAVHSELRGAITIYRTKREKEHAHR